MSMRIKCVRLCERQDAIKKAEKDGYELDSTMFICGNGRCKVMLKFKCKETNEDKKLNTCLTQ